MADFDPFQPFRDHRQLVLRLEGPIVDVIFRRVGPPNPDLPGFFEKKAAKAIIDTGASDVCIDYRLAHALNLTAIDRRQMRAANGPAVSNIYPVLLSVPELDFAERVEAWSGDLGADRGGYWALLGRSFLRSYYFGYDGPQGLFFAIHVDKLNRPPPDDED